MPGAVPHLVNINRDADDDVQQVSERQATDQYVRPVSHTFILVDDPQEGGVTDDADDEHQAGHHRVDVLEGVSDLRGPSAHGRQAAAGHGEVGPHWTRYFSVCESRSLGDGRRRLRSLLLRLQLSAGHKYVNRQDE